jgi:hypothetical protein
LEIEAVALKSRRWLSAILMAAAVSPACAEAAPGEPARSVADEAAAMERTRCGPDVDESVLAPIVTGQAIDSVEPLYSRSASGKSETGERLHGALIRVRALPGMTAEWLDRALECHSARRLLGRVPREAAPNDPFWLPGRAVDIDAKSGRDVFLVAVEGATLDDAQEVLIRANALMSAKAR